ncbi:MAG: DUF1566 domain-containing protein [Bacteroidales bacterium]
MKRVLLLVIITFSIAAIWAQSPEKISYQSVVRSSGNFLLTSTRITMRLSILQGTSSGEAVYVELHNPTTNANGLASIEIGGGVVVSGGFSSIDWSNGIYFIKTEIDPTGGTNYTISGVSQLLSVPYSLYSKKAEALVNPINYNNLVNKPITDGSETIILGGASISISGNGTEISPYIVNSTIGSHYVGEVYGGGVIFWVNETKSHGLIVSMIDLSTSQTWSNINTSIGTSASSDWNGLGNSTAIISQTGHTNSAARLCLNYTNNDYGTGIFDDWYLPSIAELEIISKNFFEVQKALDNDNNSSTIPLAKILYWSSSESSTSAFSHNFLTGVYGAGVKNNAYRVRAIRSF